MLFLARCVIVLTFATTAVAQKKPATQTCESLKAAAASYSAAFLEEIRDRPSPTAARIAQVRAELDRYKRLIADACATQSG